MESRWSYPTEGHWSQADTVRDPKGETLGAITTTFDGERVTRTVEPINGPPQTDIWDRDGPVPTMQNVVAPALAIPVLLDLAAAAIGAVIVGKAIDDTIARQGTAGVLGGSEMAGPTDGKPGKGHNNPPEPVDDDKRPPSGPSVPPFLPGQRSNSGEGEREDVAYYRQARSLNLRVERSTTRRLLDNQAMSVDEYIGKYMVGSVRSQIPTDVRAGTIGEALRSGNSKVRKILTQERFMR